MEEPVNDLVMFLRARLDQQYDEAYADREFSNLAGVQEYSDFIVRDIEAKRRILDEHTIEKSYGIGPEMTRVKYDVCSTCSNKHGIPCTTVRLLALPYADHHDYRQEWKP